MSPAVPPTMKALVIANRPITYPETPESPDYANDALLIERSVPTPGHNQILVRVEAFAANPTDTFSIDYVGPGGCIIGCDFAGVVVATGPNAKIHKIGDRVLGVVHGGSYPDIGSAAEYCVIADDLAITIPRTISVVDAPTFGIGLCTAAAVLYDKQGIPFPPAKVDGSPWYFVSGGATSVGLFLIQLAKLAGFRVVATAFPRSYDLVKSYGADHVVSYADHAAAIAEIYELTAGGVTHAVDCVGGEANIRFAVDAVGPAGGQVTTLLPDTGASYRAEVVLTDVLLYRYLGTGAFTYVPGVASMTFPDEPEKRAFLADFAARATSMIESYGIKPNPVEVNKGIEAVPAGWNRLRKQQVKGKKLVFDFRV